MTFGVCAGAVSLLLRPMKTKKEAYSPPSASQRAAGVMMILKPFPSFFLLVSQPRLSYENLQNIGGLVREEVSVTANTI